MRHGSKLAFYGLTALTVFVLLLLCWGFSPLNGVVKTLLTVAVLMLAGGLCLWRKRGTAAVNTVTPLDDLPDSTFSQPVVLVCGDELNALFGDADTSVRMTQYGCYVKTDAAIPLSSVVDAILLQRPGWRRQLALLYSARPECSTDEAVYRAGLKNWRQQVHGLQKRLGCTFPLLVSCWLNGPDSPWFVCNADGSVDVRAEDDRDTTLTAWLNAADIAQQSARAAMIPGLTIALSWLHEVVLGEMQSADALSHALYPMALGMRFLPLPAVDGNLWGRELQRHSTLDTLISPPAESPVLPFPDVLLPPLADVTERARAGLAPVWGVMIVMLGAVAALGCVIENNQRLISRIGLDLTRYQAIAMTRYEPKAQALQVLKHDALLLERWHRQGEPLRLGLGLYGGEPLWLALQTEIDRYVPPPPPPPPPPKTPQTVRLDSLALFDAGRFTLKEGSTKVLVDALINIKARPGWLIVVSGHTDLTGDAQANQQLSLKRAEAVRDWMLATSDVSPTCFAVQGYGISRPVATNDTEAGRAANRRVEISLVPQANACQAEGHTASPENRDALIPPQSMEK